MELLQGHVLYKKNKESIAVEEALLNKEIIGFYFSAHWCPPCRGFTPILADFYEELKDSDDSFEVIFISSDNTEEAMFSYMNESHGDWLVTSHKSRLSEEIRNKYSVRGIPMLIIVKKDGTLVTESGRRDVETKGVRAYSEWRR